MTQQTNLGLVWAKNGGVTPVDNTKYESGWVAEIPTYQNFNYQVQTTDKNILKYAEEGVYDWEAIISYKPGARVIVDGKRYTCKANALNKNPTTDTSGSFWVEGWLVGNSFTGLRKTDGSKIELAVRPNRNWTGQDQTIVNLNPMTAYVTTDTSKNWAISNVDGEMTVVDLGTSSGFLSPNGANLAKGAGKTFRLYHEGFKPTVSDVAGGVEEAPADGKYYARVGLSGTSGQWVKVTTNQVSATRPKPAVGSGMGWYNLEDGTYYIDIFDGDTSQWVPASPPMIPIRDASGIGFEPKTSGLGDNVQTAIERVNNSKLNLSNIQESTGNSYVYPMSQQSVTSALGSYKQQAINEAASIAALDATAKVDAVEVGGRNFLLGSKSIVVGSLTSLPGRQSEYAVTSIGRSWIDNCSDGDVVTISFDVQMAKGDFLLVYDSNRPGPFVFVGKSFYNVGTAKRRLSFVTTLSAKSNPQWAVDSLEFFSTYGTSDWFEITNIKLEKGNKATDWTPAPEDVTAHAEKYTDTAITNLGLGTAATKNIGTGAGNVIEVGAFGLGYAKKAEDFSERIDSGFYLSTDGSVGMPSGMLADGGWMINHNWAYNNVGNRYNCSFYGNVQNNFIGFRRINNEGVPQAPVELHHTGNILTTTGTSTKFPMSQKAVTEALDAAASAASAAQSLASINQGSISSATDIGPVTTTHVRQVNVSRLSEANGTYSQVNVSRLSEANGTYSQVNACLDGIASGNNAQVNACYSAYSSATFGQVNASARTMSHHNYASVWGYADYSGDTSTANQSIRLESQGGVGRFKGNVTTSGFDYAEYFPNLTRGVIPNGTIVTLSEDKVLPAQEGDFILGVVSGTSGVIGNSAEFCWHKRHLVDEFGVTITEQKEMVSFDDYFGPVSECSKPIPTDAKRWMEALPIENPDYTDICSEYKSRGERKEDWSIIGLMGQVFVRTSEQLVEGDYVSSSGSKSTEETRLRVMKMTTDFDLDKGYGVAFCLIR